MSIGQIILILVSVLVAAGVCQRALDRLRLTDRQALLFVALIFIGGLLPDISIGRARVNVGGALVPFGLAVYVWARAGSAKERLRALLRALRAEGRSILLVTHDVEFAAAVADRCALFFDGEIIADGAPNEFFSGNHFYTTAASRIARTLLPNAVLCEEVVALCRRGRE